MKKLIKSNNRLLKNNSSTCKIIEYVFNQPNLGIAHAQISGRYPAEQNKKAINKKCDLIYFVLAGNGTLHTPDGNFEVEIHDAIYLTHNEWYWVEGSNLAVLVISAPEWTVEQYLVV